MKDRYDNWPRIVVGLSLPSCAYCNGLGSQKGSPGPCKCVLREVFRLCLKRFRACLGKIADGESHAAGYRGTGGNKDVEFEADFVCIAKRTLKAPDWFIFRYYVLAGNDYRYCCRKLHMTRGPFYHRVYAIEEMVGRAFAETEPYALYPIEDYYEDLERQGIPFADRKPRRIAEPRFKIRTDRPVRNIPKKEWLAIAA